MALPGSDHLTWKAFIKELPPKGEIILFSSATKSLQIGFVDAQNKLRDVNNHLVTDDLGHWCLPPKAPNKFTGVFYREGELRAA